MSLRSLTLPAALTTLLLAAPAAALDIQRSVIVLDLQHEKADAQTARLLGELIAGTAGKIDGLRVSSGADIRTLIELETERQALGCDDAADSCLAEIAGAMGADLVLFGSVGHLGDLFLVTLNLFDNNRSTTVARENVRARDLAELPDAVDVAVRKLLDAPSVAPEATASAGEPLNVWPFVGGGVAVVGGVLVVGGLVVADAEAARYSQVDLPDAAKSSAFETSVGALGVSVVGAALLVGGTVLAVLPFLGGAE